MVCLRALDPKVYLKYLKEIPKKYLLESRNCNGPDNRKGNKVYFEACYDFRHTLTHMLFEESGGMIFDFKGRHGGDNISYLLDFSCLTKLVFENENDTSMAVFGIQGKCPNLRNVTYISRIAASDEHIKAEIKRLDQIARQSSLSAPSITTHHPNRNLTKLKLQVDSMSASYIEYLTNYSSPHLNTVALCINGTDLHAWLGQVGMENALKLTKYFSKMKSATLQLSDSLDQVYETDYATLESRMTKFLTLLQCFMGGRALKCSAEFEISDASTFTDSIVVKDNMN